MDINNDGSVSNGFENLSEENYRNIFSILRNFLSSYSSKPSDVSNENWLNNILAEYLPNKPPEEISSMSRDIFANVSQFEQNRQEASQARMDGLKPHEWTAKKIQETAVGMSAREYGETIGNLYSTYKHGNEEMMKTILKKDGTVNMNPNLDGFIAETETANIFNKNAVLNDSVKRMEVLRPEGSTYGKNSADVRIFDKNTNKTIEYGQMKFGKDAPSTSRMIKGGDYKGQAIFVPTEQYSEVKKICPEHDIRDSGVTKEFVKSKQEQAQVGENILESSALDLGKQVAFAGVAGAAVGAGAHVISKILSDEKIEADEVIGAALKSGADSGIKAAVGGALEIAVENKLLPAAVGAGISKIAGPLVEGVKIVGDLITGEIDGEEAVSRLMWLGASTFITDVALGGISLTGALTAALPIICSPVGVAVGLAVGAIAFGSEICDAVGSAFDTIGNIASDIWDGMGTVIDGIGSAVGGIIDWLLD